MTKTDKIMKNGFQRSQLCQAPVAHACNPSYSGGRDQEHLGLKPGWANSSPDPILKMPITKKGLVEWLMVKALSSNPSTAKQISKS
jgi:hypothetical protein